MELTDITVLMEGLNKAPLRCSSVLEDFFCRTGDPDRKKSAFLPEDCSKRTRKDKMNITF